MVKVLELFSGTGSVGKVCKELGYTVVSLDLKGADINTNILDWDYTTYHPSHFDIIWASPPCNTFSCLRNTWIGRRLKSHGGEICSPELLLSDITTIGLPILRRAETIIDYFKGNPELLWFIENPKSGKMKEYLNLPYYDVDYCKYSNWGYKKPTRIWTNLTGFEPRICKNDCEMINDGKHIVNFGASKMVLVDGKIIKVKSKADRILYSQNENIQQKNLTLAERYRIPPDLIKELLKNS
jgi:hypothetical protein